MKEKCHELIADGTYYTPRSVNLDAEPTLLWTTTTAAHNRDDRCVVEIIASKNLRQSFKLVDGATVTVDLLCDPKL